MGGTLQEEQERSRGRSPDPLRPGSLLSSQASTPHQGPIQATWGPRGIGGRLGRSGEAGGRGLPRPQTREAGEEGIYSAHSSPGSLLSSQVRSPAL